MLGGCWWCSSVSNSCVAIFCHLRRLTLPPCRRLLPLEPSRVHRGRRRCRRVTVARSTPCCLPLHARPTSPPPPPPFVCTPRQLSGHGHHRVCLRRRHDGSEEAKARCVRPELQRRSPHLEEQQRRRDIERPRAVARGAPLLVRRHVALQLRGAIEWAHRCASPGCLCPRAPRTAAYLALKWELLSNGSAVPTRLPRTRCPAAGSAPRCRGGGKASGQARAAARGCGTCSSARPACAPAYARVDMTVVLIPSADCVGV